MTTVQIVLSIIVSAITIFTFLGALFIKLNKRVMKNIMNEIKPIIDKQDAAIERTDAKIDKLTLSVEEQNKNIEKKLDRHEMWRLRDNILIVAQLLRSIEDADSVSENIFSNVFNDHDEYNKLGGNSYVDAEMKYIEKVYEKRTKRPSRRK